jgi:hypothetical protein
MNRTELLAAVQARASKVTYTHPADASRLRAYAARLQSQAPESEDAGYDGPATALASWLNTFAANGVSIRQAVANNTHAGAAVCGALIGELGLHEEA